MYQILNVSIDWHYNHTMLNKPLTNTQYTLYIINFNKIANITINLQFEQLWTLQHHNKQFIRSYLCNLLDFMYYKVSRFLIFDSSA